MRKGNQCLEVYTVNFSNSAEAHKENPICNLICMKNSIGLHQKFHWCLPPHQHHIITDRFIIPRSLLPHNSRLHDIIYDQPMYAPLNNNKHITRNSVGTYDYLSKRLIVINEVQHFDQIIISLFRCIFSIRHKQELNSLEMQLINVFSYRTFESLKSYIKLKTCRFLHH